MGMGIWVGYIIAGLITAWVAWRIERRTTDDEMTSGLVVIAAVLQGAVWPATLLAGAAISVLGGIAWLIGRAARQLNHESAPRP